MNDQPNVYMLQGFFFQERTLLGVEMMPIHGAVAVVRQGVVRDMFAGVIGLDEFSLDWTGSLTDAFGESILDRIELTDTSLEFDKVYERRGDRIHYTFRKDGELWLGEYNGERVGSGNANCILTPISQQIFQSAD